MKFISQLLAASLLWILIACNKKEGPTQVSILTNDAALAKEVYKAEDAGGGLMAVDSAIAPVNNQPKQPSSPGKEQTGQDWDKKIIKTGTLSLEVKDYNNFNGLVHAGIKKIGGYIAQEEQSQSDYKVENTVIMMVPVEQFDAAIAALTVGTEKIVEMKITSEDVTGQMVDAKSRMEAKKRVRDRYLDLLKQAKNMEEILQVQTEVNGIQENIEAAAGRVAYLGHASAFSTIHVSFYQVLNASLVTDPGSSYSYRIIASFKSGLHWFAELFVILISLWPLWLGLLMAWFFIKKWKTAPAKNSKQVS